MLATSAEQTARTVAIPEEQAGALASVAEAWAHLGQWDRAERIARSITNPQDQGWPLVAVVEALLKAGQWNRAEQFAHTITNPKAGTWALTSVAQALIETDPARAAALATNVEQTARTIRDPYYQVWARSAVVDALAEGGQWDRAEEIARTMASPDHQAEALSAVARSLAAINLERATALAVEAEDITRTIPNLVARGRASVAVARALTQVGQWSRAEQIARALMDSDFRAEVLFLVAKAMASVDPERAKALVATAEQAAAAITSPDDKARALSAVAAALADMDQERAIALATRAEHIARTMTGPDDQAWALSNVVGALARLGQWKRAERIALTITDPFHRTRAVAIVAEAMMEADPEGAIALAATAEEMARTTSNSTDEAWALEAVVEVFVKAGRLERAEHIAPTIERPNVQARAFAMIATHLMANLSLDRPGRGESPQSRAHQLLLEVLGGEHWVEAIGPLGKLSSAWVMAIADALRTSELEAADLSM